MTIIDESRLSHTPFYHVTSLGNERRNTQKSKRDRKKSFEYLDLPILRYRLTFRDRRIQRVLGKSEIFPEEIK